MVALCVLGLKDLCLCVHLIPQNSAADWAHVIRHGHLPISVHLVSTLVRHELLAGLTFTGLEFRQRRHITFTFSG